MNIQFVFITLFIDKGQNASVASKFFIRNKIFLASEVRKRRLRQNCQRMSILMEISFTRFTYLTHFKTELSFLNCNFSTKKIESKIEMMSLSVQELFSARQNSENTLFNYPSPSISICKSI